MEFDVVSAGEQELSTIYIVALTYGHELYLKFPLQDSWAQPYREGHC